MAKEICISTTPHETRLAILEDDQLAEIYYERENEYTLAGSIYKGRVTRVLPGMQSSFVDVGLERDAFLYVTDFLEEQEDSDEYASDGNGGGGRREARPQAESLGDEPQGRAAGTERNQDRNGERSSGGERGHDRHADRGGRRPAAAAAPQQAEPPREGGRAGRERAREQAVAPLREATPAAQDLDEKGDDESPEGTRRWRGRRGRRRGVRGGLPRAESQVGAGQSEETFEGAGSAEEVGALPPSLPEYSPAGDVHALHASPSVREEEPVRRGDRGRERRPRGPREPYAQASTLDRPVLDRSLPEHSHAQESVAEAGGFDTRSEGPSDAAPRAGAGSGSSSGAAIVLPGESLSKYGSAPADPAAASAVATATVPRPVRPVNYIAAKPSTLVELPNDWDGGAVMPGETLSRYRAPSGGATSQMHDETSAPHASDAVSEASSSSEVDLAPVHTELIPHDEPLLAGSLEELASRPTEHAESPEVDPGSNPAEFEPGHHEPEQAAKPGHHEPEQAAEPVPLAEPEIVAAALSPAAEAGAPHTAEPEFVHVGDQAAATQAVDEQPEPAEYEPENASASYRVQRTGPSELRLPSPEIDEETTLESMPAAAASPAFAEPVGEFAGAAAEHVPEHAGDAPAESIGEAPGSFTSETPGQVEEFAGQLAPATGSHAEGEAQPVRDPEPWPAQALRILHEDGTVDLAAAHESFSETSGLHALQFQSSPPPAFEPHSFEPTSSESPSLETHGFEPEGFGSPGSEPHSSEPDGFESMPGLSPDARAQQAEAELAASPRQAHEFSEPVDSMHVAPGYGLLEEETIDEEEYDFEPLHAHAEEGDQEDLEEETLDQHMDPAALSDAVRETHLEKRVHGGQPVAEAASFAVEEDEAAFGYEEAEEGEEDFEEEEGEEPIPSAQPGEPQRAGRPDDRARRGRSNGRSGGRPGSRNGGRGRSAQTQSLPVISELLKQGQEILVQIAKEPIAKKGARITSHIALPGRFLVFMPTVSHVGVSRKIASDEERQRLKRILISEKGDSSGGFIVRTAAEGASEEDLRADLRFLISLWTEIKQRSDTAKAPALIYHDLNLIERILRDQVSSNFSTIWVDSEAEYERIIRFLSRFQPGLVRRVKLYTKETPLFEHFGIQEEISKALKSKVWLKSGGSIVINQTEALVAIDINTGKYVGKTSRLEDTIVKTNLDAIPEIVRQIRLRDLGGIIVIDFIDMDERKNRNKVLAALEEELKNDRAPSKVLQFNDFGLVAITRKRVKQSLERTLSVTCETCTGTGMVKSPITVCNEIYTEMRKMQKHLDGKDVMLRVHPEVVKQLKAGNGKWINELEEMVTKTIIIKSDPALHPEQFDIH